ncbi:hypothetical protein JCM10212_003631 [Sporobolomyces blumeae]
MIRYTDLCDVLKIPAFPITSTMIALFLLPSARHARDKDLADRAIAEFQAERATIRIRATPGKSGRPKDKGPKDKGNSSHEASQQGEGSAGWPSEKGGRYASDSINMDSPLDERDESESDLDFSADEDVDDCQQPTASTSAAGAAHGHRNPTPNLPQPGDRFSDFEELLSATYRALLPVYGLGARYKGFGTTPLYCARSKQMYRDSNDGICDWKLGFTVDPSTKEHVVDAATSNLYHNHGPHPNLLKKPARRPIMMNERIRRDLGMPPLRPRVDRSSTTSPSTPTAISTSSQSRSTPATPIDSPSHPNKKPRLASPSARLEGSDRTKCSAIVTQPRSTSSSHARIDTPRPPPIPMSTSPASLFDGDNLSLPAATDSPCDRLKTQRQGSPSESFSSSPLVSLASTPRPSESFESLLVAFLASFDLALAPLADCVVDGGWITSREDLVELCALDRATRSIVVEAVLKELDTRSGSGGGSDAVKKAVDKMEESFGSSRGPGWRT